MYSILLFVYKKKVIKIELSNTVKTNFVDSMDTKKIHFNYITIAPESDWYFELMQIVVEQFME